VSESTDRLEAEEKAPVERLREEAEKALGDDFDPTTLGGTLQGRAGSLEVEVLNPLDWDFDAEAHLLGGDYAAFLRAILDDDTFARLQEIRPTKWQVLQFITGARDGGGEGLGESPAS
jgi:hypothetical protein